jgi:organic hydroperoxide reductase OsmC/OhrA
VTGEVELEDKVLVIKRISVTYNLRIAKEHLSTAARVHGFHADFCPVARSIGNCIEIRTTLQTESL